MVQELTSYPDLTVQLLVITRTQFGNWTSLLRRAVERSRKPMGLSEEREKQDLDNALTRFFSRPAINYWHIMSAIYEGQLRGKPPTRRAVEESLPTYDDNRLERT